MSMRWRREPAATGLARIGAGPRSSGLYDGNAKYAMVSALRRSYVTIGWYWVAGWNSNVPYKNSSNEKLTDEATAKANAMAYVRQYITKSIGIAAATDENGAT